MSGRPTIDRRAALAGLTGAAVAGALSPGRAAAPKTLRIGYQKNGVFLVAKIRGQLDKSFAEEGVSVEWREFSFGPPLVEALNVGAIDLGSVGDTPPIFAQAARSKFVYAASHAATGAAIIVPDASPIRAVKELRGKRISIPKGSSAHNVTVAALEQAGLSFDDITPVYLAPADGQAAFARGAVDAWTVWDPYLAVAEEVAGARIVTLATSVAPQYSFALAARAFAEAQPVLLARTIEEIGKAGVWADAHHEQVAALFSEATGTSLAVQKRAIARALYRVGPVTPEIVAAQQRSADRFARLGLIPAPIKVAEAVWRTGA